MILAVAFVIVFALTAPAHAQDALRVGMDTDIQNLVAGPDGGAWTSTYTYDEPAIQRIEPGAAARQVAENTWADAATLGPDGRAWFTIVGGGLARVDAAGTLTAFAAERLGNRLAPAPDGTVWATTLDRRTLLRVTPDGVTSPVPLDLPNCDGRGWPSDLATASDGALWFYVVACGFVRVPPGGAPTVIADPRGLLVDQLEPDHAGGVWFRSDLAPGGGHVDASGRVTPLRGVGGTYDVDVAPDGSAWFTTHKCVLLRAHADGRVTSTPTAIPTWLLDFDPAGGLWLASRVRVRHTQLGAPAVGCDDKPPAVRVSPRPAKRVSLAALRRNRGFTFTVREPFAIEAFVTYSGEDPFAGADAVVTRRTGRTVRVKLSARRLRQIERRTNVVLHVLADVRDREGNSTSIDREVRITP